MAPGFARSISFPLSPSCRRAASYHVRSVSLPCRSNPLLSQLREHIHAVRSWLADADDGAASTCFSGLAHLHALHAALAELILLPEARSALRCGSAARLLDAFLVLADAHGAFQEAGLELRAHASEAQAALRRRDAARLASAVRSQRRAEKDLARLASSVRGAASCSSSSRSMTYWSSAAEVEVSGALAEAVHAAASASAAVFSAVESMSAAATALAASSSKKTTAVASLISLVKKRSSQAADDEKEIGALERLEELERCIAEMESGSDMVFRSILHTRVALLNIHCSC